MERILGQDHALEIIHAALSGGRMHHAWIFHGPPGVGKFTAALALAELLLCHKPRDGADDRPEPCGACPSCRLLARPDAAHPDLHVIAKELARDSDLAELRRRKQINIPVDLLREHMVGGWVGGGEARKYVEPIVGRRSTLRHGRVFIIDEAELLAREGQNILLKTLEEPPPGVHIILVTTSENRLLPTVRSRCQRVGFRPLDEPTVERWLAGRPEAAELTDAQRRRAARFAGGSLGRALLAVRYGLHEWIEILEPMIAQVAEGRPQPQLGQTMAELVDRYAQQWVDDHKGASKDAANKAAVRQALALLAGLCRRGLRERAGSADSADLAGLERRLLPWLLGVELVEQAERQLQSNVAPLLLLDNLAIQWAVSAQPQAIGR